MPQATATGGTIERDLATCEGGKVTLRKLSYGEVLERREMASSMRAAARNRAQRRGNESPDGEVQVDVHYTAIQLYDFARCITDHNLEDEKGRKLNLGSRDDLTKLDPKIGQEIERLIDELNNPEEEEEEGSKSPEVASVGPPGTERGTEREGGK